MSSEADELRQRIRRLRDILRQMTDESMQKAIRDAIAKAEAKLAKLTRR